MIGLPPRSPLFPYTTLFRSVLLSRAGFEAERIEDFKGLNARSPLKSSIRSRSEEHTSELQSQFHLVCRLPLEKKKRISSPPPTNPTPIPPTTDTTRTLTSTS